MKPPGRSASETLPGQRDDTPRLAGEARAPDPPSGGQLRSDGNRRRETACGLWWALILFGGLLRAEDPGAAPGRWDQLQLVGGEVVAGAIQDQSLVLRTSYARLEFVLGDLERIEVERPPANLTVLHTVNRDRLSGFLENAAFELETTNRESRTIRRERVQTILLAPRASAPLPEAAGEPPGGSGRDEAREVAMALRNGDLLNGSLLADSLGLVQTDGSRADVSVGDVAFVTFADTPQTHVGIRLLTGGTVQGRLVPEELAVVLESGAVIRVFSGRIQLIDRRRWAGLTPGMSPGAMLPGTSGGPGLAGLLIWIPPGEFLLGSPSSEAGRDLDEGPLTPVVIPEGFWLGRCEVTQAEYQAVMGRNPSQYSGFADYPVEKVSWEDAMAYCQRLTRLHRDTGAIPDSYEYRLPTEAEWEYACRAGSTTAYSHGDDRDGAELADFAWFTNNSDSSPHTVGAQRPNPWGLYDMHGNVWEWCLDRLTEADRGQLHTNEVSTATGHLRVARGGSWLYSAPHCRSANRDEYAAGNRCSDVGFRVVMAPSPGARP